MPDFNRPTDIEIIDTLGRALRTYFDNHPEAAKTKIVFEVKDDGLLRSLHFSRRP